MERLGSAKRKPVDKGPALRPPRQIRTEEREPEAELTSEQLEDLRKQLEGQREALVLAIDERQKEEREISRDVGDEMDDASTEGASSMLSKLLERDVRMLAEVERALNKFRTGTYGYCEATGEPIGFARLHLRPWARFGVEYQEEVERQQRTRGGL